MHAASALLETQRRFLAALYDDNDAGPIAWIAGNGLEPAARLRIYRRSCSETQIAALRTTYPGVLALVGEAFFELTARGYRRTFPSRSGNLQTFGAHLADYLEEVPETRALSYLPDVARLEWLRQETALAADAEPMPPNVLAPIIVRPSVRLLASRHAVLTIWRYALDPTPERLQLTNQGERIALWREDDEVAMATLDAASFAYIEALARGTVLEDAQRAAWTIDPAFDLPTCIESFAAHGLIAACARQDCHAEYPAWR